MLQLRLHPPHTQQVPEHNVVPERREEGQTGGEDVHQLHQTDNRTDSTTGSQMSALLQDSRGEEDVQRPLDLVGEAEGRPAGGRDLTRGGVLWRSGSISGSCRL